MTYEVVAVHINGGQDQTGHEHNQAKGQAAQAVERRLPGPQGQNQFLLILGKRETNIDRWLLPRQTDGLKEPTGRLERRVVSNVPDSPGLAPQLALPCVGCSWHGATTADGSRFCASIGKSELWKDSMEVRHSAPQ